MDTRLTQEQLIKLVGEIERISQRQQDELDRPQVEEILRELNLSPALVDDAMIQLQRREALAAQQRRNRRIVGGVIAGLIVAIASITFLIHQNQQTLAQVRAQQDRMTLVQDDGGNLKTVAAQGNPELFYRVTLKDAPVGQTLSLSCSWTDPSGQVVKENHYQTRPIDTGIWQTHCRYQLGSAAAPGTWKVQMSLAGRNISDATFEVK